MHSSMLSSPRGLIAALLALAPLTLSACASSAEPPAGQATGGSTGQQTCQEWLGLTDIEQEGAVRKITLKSGKEPEDVGGWRDVIETCTSGPDKLLEQVVEQQIATSSPTSSGPSKPTESPIDSSESSMYVLEAAGEVSLKDKDGYEFSISFDFQSGAGFESDVSNSKPGETALRSPSDASGSLTIENLTPQRTTPVGGLELHGVYGLYPKKSQICEMFKPQVGGAFLDFSAHCAVPLAVLDFTSAPDDWVMNGLRELSPGQEETIELAPLAQTIDGFAEGKISDVIEQANRPLGMYLWVATEQLVPDSNWPVWELAAGRACYGNPYRGILVVVDEAAPASCKVFAGHS